MSWTYSDLTTRRYKQPISHTAFNYIADLIRKKDLDALTEALKQEDAQLIDSDSLTVLHASVRWDSSTCTLKKLLKNRRVLKLLEREMYNGDTPFLAAARYGNTAAAQLLIDNGANIYKKVADTGNTVLHLAAMNSDCDLMNIILSRKPSMNFINVRNLYGDTALQLALVEHSPTVRILLQAGADYLQPNLFTGRNILHTCVAYNQCGIVQELLLDANARSLVNVVDNRGDTPLMLSVRLACLQCIKAMIGHVQPGKEVNENTKESILHMVVQTENVQNLKYLLMFSHEKLINYKDGNGKTPLLLAIEEHKNICLERLMNTQNVYIKCDKTQETALHTAIRVNNQHALSLLLESRNQTTSWCFSQKDHEGKTPFWLAVELNHTSFIVESRKGGLIDVDELNSLGDSAIFVAAAYGHLEVLKALLLSDKYYRFCKDYSIDVDLKGRKKLFINAEICCDVYTSDLFILTNAPRKSIFHMWIPERLQTPNTKTGRNLFHACALGGNLPCLSFIYNYFRLFDLDLSLFDSPDNNGDTPLLLATRNHRGGPDCVYFFLSAGANISKYNRLGDYPLKSMFVNTEKSDTILLTLLDDAIMYDKTVRGLEEENETLQVDFTLFRPANEPSTKVIKLFYETLQGHHRNKILQHALFKTYINILLDSVNFFFFFRIMLSIFTTILLTIYIILITAGQQQNEESSAVTQSLRFILCTLSLIGLLFSVPLLFHYKIHPIAILINVLMYVTRLSVILFVILPYTSTLTLKVGSITVLLSWISLLMYSTAVFRDISHQMTMLSQVLAGMLKYSLIVILTLIQFSLVFYCIFNDSYYFSNPIKSFIYTSFVLLHGDTADTFIYFEEKHYSEYTNSIGSNGSLNTSSLRSVSDIFMESLFLTTFIIVCVLGLMSMLVGLAVRDGKTLTADGEVFRRRLQILWMSSLEKFLRSDLYQVLKWTRLIYLFGVIPSEDLLYLKTKYSPMSEKNSGIFSRRSVINMKRSVIGPKKRTDFTASTL